MPENPRNDVPDRRKAADLIQAAFKNTFPMLPAWEVPTDRRDHGAEGKIREVGKDPDGRDEAQSIPRAPVVASQPRQLAFGSL